MGSRRFGQTLAVEAAEAAEGGTQRREERLGFAERHVGGRGTPASEGSDERDHGGWGDE
jgi:hypothetical protein